ncbi:MAG TPA: carboxymuconolactone decarboxylase family protein [Xanthobacteraceae bacterium]|nr:carboxymuconolactone decarboxylase family protein [Xanthobacteraceae bacterium]
MKSALKTGNLESPADTFLPPIERPRGLALKLMFAMIQRQFGKVFMPLKVFSARMPLAFMSFYGKIARLDKKLTLPRETIMLIRQQVARINVCEFCIDLQRWAAIKESMNEAKFNALDQYKTSSLFTDAERAALDYATKLTREKKMDADTFARLARFYSEREICEIVWLVASEHLYNLTNIGLNIHSDMLCQLDTQKRKAA